LGPRGLNRTKKNAAQEKFVSFGEGASTQRIGKCKKILHPNHGEKEKPNWVKEKRGRAKKAPLTRRVSVGKLETSKEIQAGGMALFGNSILRKRPK